MWQNHDSFINMTDASARFGQQQREREREIKEGEIHRYIFMQHSQDTLTIYLLSTLALMCWLACWFHRSRSDLWREGGGIICDLKKKKKELGSLTPKIHWDVMAYGSALAKLNWDPNLTRVCIFESEPDWYCHIWNLNMNQDPMLYFCCFFSITDLSDPRSVRTLEGWAIVCNLIKKKSLDPKLQGAIEMLWLRLLFRPKTVLCIRFSHSRTLPWL